MAKNPKDPSVTSAAHDVMLPRWKLLDTVLAGTEAMRAAGRALLPQHTGESDARYAARLQMAVLENMLEHTLNKLSAKPFSDPVQPNDDVPKPIAEQVLPDVDLQGNSLDVFCRSWFRTSLHKGVIGMLVEFPKVRPKEGGKPRTLDDDRREKLRPYWQMIMPENILAAYGSIVDGVEKLTHVRILETVRERAEGEFIETDIPQIRVLEPGKVVIYRKGGGKRKTDWVKHEEWNTGLTFVPMVLFYTAKREDTMECKPPLLDLAYLNVAHWQSTADQRNVLAVARFPMLACSGGTNTEGESQVKIGPYQLLQNDDPQGKFYYVEHTGAAIEAGRNDLKDLVESMEQYGAEFLKDKPGDTTATGRAIDSAEAVSTLKALAIMFRDSVALALDYTAQWMRLGDSGGTVAMNVDFGVDEAEKDIKPAIEMRKNRDISRKAMVEIAKERGYLPQDFDADADALLLEEELAAIAEAMADLDPQGGNSPPSGGSEE